MEAGSDIAKRRGFRESYGDVAAGLLNGVLGRIAVETPETRGVQLASLAAEIVAKEATEIAAE